MSETVAAVVERCAGYERRGLMLYRRLADRFAADPAGATWRQMSNAEAAHFTTLQLAGDWLAMAGAAQTPADAAAVGEHAAVEARLEELERAAAADGLTAADAAALTLEWEELELRRVLALLALLPPLVRDRVRGGMVNELPEHHGDLLRLVVAVGAAALASRVEALARRGGQA